MPFSGNEKKVLAKLKREFFQKGEYGVLDNWIEYQFERNFRNEERTREALAKDKDYRLQIEHLHVSHLQQKTRYQPLSSFQRQRNQVKENSLKAQKLADEIEMLVRQRNMQLEEVEVNEVPHILIDVHWLTVRRTLEYVSQIEWALKKNPGNLVGKRQSNEQMYEVTHSWIILFQFCQ